MAGPLSVLALCIGFALQAGARFFFTVADFFAEVGEPRLVVVLATVGTVACAVFGVQALTGVLRWFFRLFRILD